MKIMKHQVTNLLLGAGFSCFNYYLFGFEMGVIVGIGFIYGTLIYIEVNK
jgi:hypothetical protein